MHFYAFFNHYYGSIFEITLKINPLFFPSIAHEQNAQNENFNDPIFIDKSKDDYRSNCFETQNNVPQFDGLWPVTTPNTIDITYATRNKYSADRGAIENYLDLKATKTDFTVGAQVCAGASVTSNIYVKNLFVDTVYNFNVSSFEV